MNQSEFKDLKIDDTVLTVYKGHVVKMAITSIYDGGHCKKNVELLVPNSTKIILRHMYNIYKEDLI